MDEGLETEGPESMPWPWVRSFAGALFLDEGLGGSVALVGGVEDASAHGEGRLAGGIPLFRGEVRLAGKGFEGLECQGLLILLEGILGGGGSGLGLGAGGVEGGVESLGDLGGRDGFGCGLVPRSR